MNEKGISAVMGVILMVVVTLAIAVTVLVYIISLPDSYTRYNDYMDEQLQIKDDSCSCDLSDEYIKGWNDAKDVTNDYLFPDYSCINCTGVE